MWKIKHIFDGEYGCEELAEGQRPKVSVTLINEKEEETCFSVEDSWHDVCRTQSRERSRRDC